MTHDFTYLNQLPVQDLIDRARAPNLVNYEHLLRALADRLEDYADTVEEYEAINETINAALTDADKRAESWREEAMAVQRQLDQVRG